VVAQMKRRHKGMEKPEALQTNGVQSPIPLHQPTEFQSSSARRPH